MKTMKRIAVFTLVLVILSLFAACPDPNSDTNKTKPGSNYTVNFEANSGSPVPRSQSIPKGGKVAMPSAMFKTGYTFGGWYKEAVCTNLWKFDTDTVSGNITLYAKWDSIGSYICTVTFEANGGNPAPDLQSIPTGNKIVMPSVITKTGYLFGGWYKEATCTNQWDFTADIVTGNITLYAQWYSPTPVTGTTLAAKFQWLRTNAASNSGYIFEVTSDYEELTSQNLSYIGKNNITIQLKGSGSSKGIAFSNCRAHAELAVLEQSI